MIGLYLVARLFSSNEFTKRIREREREIERKKERKVRDGDIYKIRP